MRKRKYPKAYLPRGYCPSPKTKELGTFYVLEVRMDGFRKDPIVHMKYMSAYKDYCKHMDIAIDLQMRPCYVLLSEIKDGKKIPLRDFGEKRLL